MITIAQLVVKVIGDTEAYSTSLKNAQNLTSKFSQEAVKGLSQIGGAVVLGGLAAAGAGVIALGGFLKSSVDAAMESQNAMADLNATLASTKGAAGLSIDALLKQAEALQGVTKFSHEQIEAGQGMLLTFTNIKGAVFQQAVPAMLNMAEKFGSVQEASIQLGKALQDPVKGVAALRRVGVMLSTTQEDQVKHFMAVGDIASAQGIILGELQTEFGGLAVAAGSTLTGRILQFNHAMDDIKETIGNAIMPVLTSLIQMLSQKLADPKTLAFINSLVTGFEHWGKVFIWIAQSALQGDIPGTFTKIGISSERNLPPWVIDAITALYQGLSTVITFLMNNQGALIGVITAIGAAIAVSA